MNMVRCRIMLIVLILCSWIDIGFGKQLLYLPFDNTLNGSNGETPIILSGTIRYQTGKSGSGVFIEEGGSATNPDNFVNIDPSFVVDADVNGLSDEWSTYGTVLNPALVTDQNVIGNLQKWDADDTSTGDGYGIRTAKTGSSWIPLPQGGDTYTLSFKYKIGSGAGMHYVLHDWNNNVFVVDGVDYGAVNLDNLSSSSLTRVTKTFRTTSSVGNFTALRLWFVSNRPQTGTITIYVGEVQVEKGAYATSYCDGSMGTGYAWTGSANISSSYRLPAQVQYETSGKISSTEGSIDLWYKPEHDSSQNIYNDRYLFSTDVIRAYLRGSDSRFVFEINDGSKWNTLTTPIQVFNSNTLMRLTFTWNKNWGYRIFINGNLANSEKKTFVPKNFSTPIYIGTDTNGQNQSNGIIDEFKIYDSEDDIFKNVLNYNIPAAGAKEIIFYDDSLSKLNIPANTFSTNVQISVENVTTTFKLPYSTAAKHIKAYEIQAINSDTMEKITTLNNLANLSLHVQSDGNVILNSDPAINLSEAKEKLSIAFWDEKSLTWIPLKSTVEISSNDRDIVVSANIRHLTTFAVISKASVFTGRLRVFPNPFTPKASSYNVVNFVLPSEEVNDVVTIKIWDTTGTLVKTISSYSNVVTWDGKNENGEFVEGGVYIYQVKVGNNIVGKGTLVVAY